MTKLTLEAGNEAKAPSKSAGQMVTDRAAARNAQVVPGLGSVDSIRKELDAIYEHMGNFSTLEPDEVMTFCSGYSARLSEIRMRIHRVEDMLQHWKAIRTKEVDPAIEEIKFQFNLASRLLTQRQLDWDMQRGQ